MRQIVALQASASSFRFRFRHAVLGRKPACRLSLHVGFVGQVGVGVAGSAESRQGKLINNIKSGERLIDGLTR